MLMEAAGYVGDIETRSVCEAILREEEIMAKWLADHAGKITRTFLEREASHSDLAKR
jgi:ferritin-like metal-binding protein YciE